MKRIVLYLFAFQLAVSGCSSVKLISSERFSGNRLSGSETFGFAELSKRVKVNRADGEKLNAFVEDLVIERMEAAGYRFVEENPELLLDLRLLLLQRDYEQRSQYRNPSNFYWRRTYGYRYDWRNEEVSVSTSMEASLSLATAIADGRQKLWSGKVLTQLSPRKTLLRLTEAVDLIVGTWLKE